MGVCLALDAELGKLPVNSKHKLEQALTQECCKNLRVT